MSAPLPCPFCGSADIEKDSYQSGRDTVVWSCTCATCGATAGLEQWNQRTPKPAVPFVVTKVEGPGVERAAIAICRRTYPEWMRAMKDWPANMSDESKEMYRECARIAITAVVQP